VAGNQQKKRYQDKFEQIVDGCIFTLEDINPAWKNHQIEKLIDRADIEIIRQNFFPDKKTLGKKQLHMAIQELIMQKNVLGFSQPTLGNFETLLNCLDNKLDLKMLV
jgi:hypothetical protein